MAFQSIVPDKVNVGMSILGNGYPMNKPRKIVIIDKRGIDPHGRKFVHGWCETGIIEGCLTHFNYYEGEPTYKFSY
jgi:hypothetical protein